MAIVAAAMVAIVVVNLTSAGGGQTSVYDTDQQSLPRYDFSAWQGVPVQDGRTKPMQTACAEAVRKITGRSRYEGIDPVELVLSWKLAAANANRYEDDTESLPKSTLPDWENRPFILCRHLALREELFAHRSAEERDQLKTGKYVSPSDLRTSPGFDRLLAGVAELRTADSSKAHFQMTVAQQKAEEVVRRLVLYDAICGRQATPLHTNAFVGQRFAKLPPSADDLTKNEAIERLVRRVEKPLDPLHWVRLDATTSSSWFSITELRSLRQQPEAWRRIVARRIAEDPYPYLTDEHQQALQEFQELLAAGEAEAPLVDLASRLSKRRGAIVAAFETACGSGDLASANRLLSQVARQASPERAAHLQADFSGPGPGLDATVANTAKAIDEALREAATKDLTRMEESFMLAVDGYNADDPKFRALHLDYLETRFPELYAEAIDARPLPIETIDRVLSKWDRLQLAYASSDAARFDRASTEFISAVGERAGSDNGVETRIAWELTYNRVQPFLWSWIVMGAALVILVMSLSLTSRTVYVAGLVLYLLSIAIQLYGFTARIYIAGRAPVGNMYETLIWAAMMSAIFALVLELIYRRKVIVIAGALVSTLGLILADQLPLALDPSINQLAPVLRTNYWLTLHVLTIVSGYAAGTLAWGLGNLSLGLLAFGKEDRFSLKLLTQFTYRAIQITVLLLAAGTFLGGWWAAESWGRFWGWDPKEVGALIALVCYVIPLHARYIGWIRDFGLALSAVVCYASIILSWYVVNFVFASGLHSYGFGGSDGMLWVLAATLLNVEWVLLTCWRCDQKRISPAG